MLVLVTQHANNSDAAYWDTQVPAEARRLADDIAAATGGRATTYAG